MELGKKRWKAHKIGANNNIPHIVEDPPTKKKTINSSNIPIPIFWTWTIPIVKAYITPANAPMAPAAVCRVILSL